MLSDTHGVLDPRVADHIHGCDWIIHAGDIGHPQVLQTLHAITSSLIAVRGNNDVAAKWPIEAHELLEQLPEVVSLDLPGGTVVVVHGHRAGSAKSRHAVLRARYPEARAIVYGHSHRMVCDTATRPWVINPGAAGRSRTYGGPACVILEASEQEWQLASRRFAPATRR